ncbi:MULTISPECIES: hypothetical protein [unclassified Microcoleus]|uniref:hypothetical protein n=1 Tax=unclassified Microcoleus TaxID=2642155 RepID=UPI002FCE9C45
MPVPQNINFIVEQASCLFIKPTFRRCGSKDNNIDEPTPRRSIQVTSLNVFSSPLTQPMTDKDYKK